MSQTPFIFKDFETLGVLKNEKTLDQGKIYGERKYCAEGSGGSTQILRSILVMP